MARVLLVIGVVVPQEAPEVDVAEHAYVFSVCRATGHGVLLAVRDRLSGTWNTVADVVPYS
jgi:hypothetical protein